MCLHFSYFFGEMCRMARWAFVCQHHQSVLPQGVLRCCSQLGVVWVPWAGAFFLGYLCLQSTVALLLSHLDVLESLLAATVCAWLNANSVICQSLVHFSHRSWSFWTLMLFFKLHCTYVLLWQLCAMHLRCDFMHPAFLLLFSSWWWHHICCPLVIQDLQHDAMSAFLP